MCEATRAQPSASNMTTALNLSELLPASELRQELIALPLQHHRNRLWQDFSRERSEAVRSRAYQEDHARDHAWVVRGAHSQRAVADLDPPADAHIDAFGGLDDTRPWISSSAGVQDHIDVYCTRLTHDGIKKTFYWLFDDPSKPKSTNHLPKFRWQCVRLLHRDERW